MEPRRLALNILNALDTSDKTLDCLMDERDTQGERRDRNLLNALVYGTIRWQGTLDFILSRFSKTPLKKIDPDVLNILRLALYQIMYLDRIPVSASVNTAVELSKSLAKPWISKFVNGVLRHAAKDYRNVRLPDKRTDPVLALAISKSFPHWLIKRWLARYGCEETERLCDVINSIPAITLRSNSLKISRDELSHDLQDHVRSIETSTYSPYGIRVTHPNVSISELKSFREGWFQVQDEAAQLVTLMLNPQPGETVLDACAGLGVKTGHICQQMKNQGHVVCMDHHEKKLDMLTVEMCRLGISIATTQVCQLDQPLKRQQDEKFDRILLDAPCSGLGVIRRNPDIKWRREAHHLKAFHDTQHRMLTHLAEWIKPNGKLVYAVCSTEPEETTDVISSFLAGHPNFSIEKTAKGLPPETAGIVNADGYFISSPHLHDMDGFFAVSLKPNSGLD